MTTYRRNLALVVEGVGSSASSTAGIAWHYGKASIGTPGNYEWIGGSGSGEGLVGAPESVSCSVDPWDCNLRGNAHTFELHATPQAKALFLRRPQKASDSLTTEINETATTLEFDGAGDYTWSASDDGTVVWIGDEAIKLGTYASGPQFTGCTRAMWSTTAQTQPAGMNIYRHNPKIVNRRCQLLVYDRDAGTTTQAWQGFVQKPMVDGPIIRIPAQDIWSAVSGAEVNRKTPKGMERFASGRLRPSRNEILGGAAIMAGKYEPRVNKSAATAPHWVALQVSDALFYANYTEGTTPASASFTDDGNNASYAALGSFLEPGGAVSLGPETPMHEVLAVDRRRDNVGNTLVSYADFRSSTRDLDEPFHPVAISMALLTSGYGAYPQGVGAPQTAPGDTIALLAGPTQYFTSGTGPEITVANGRNLDGRFLIGRRLGSSTNPHCKLIPDDGGAAVWTMASTGLSSSAGRTSGSYIDDAGAYAYVAVDGGDGVTYASSNGSKIVCRLDMSDGSIDYGSEATATSGGGGSAESSVASVDVDEANDLVYWETSAGGDEIKQFTASTGAEQAVSGNDTGVGSGIAAMCLTPDKDYLVVLGYGATPELVRYSTPMTGLANNWDDYSGNEIQCDGTDTTNDFGYAARLDYSGRVVPARDGSNKIYFCMGSFGSNENRYVGRFDPASGLYGAVDAEVDVAADADFTPGTYNFVYDIQVDQYGYVYCLVTNATSGGDVDIVRYAADLTNPFSFSADGGITFPSIGTYGEPTRIAIEDGADSVAYCTRGGYVAVYSQT